MKKYEVVTTWELPSGVTVYNYCNPAAEKELELAEGKKMMQKRKMKEIEKNLDLILSIISVFAAIPIGVLLTGIFFALSNGPMDQAWISLKHIVCALAESCSMCWFISALSKYEVVRNEFKMYLLKIKETFKKIKHFIIKR